ncbi:MAG: hypothetical protein C5S47_02310 [Candidatus Methanogasteraceae archaeon]|nr:MAG: hypothetical protein C5S47_02310 [ANME-2 cluster archaeon]
MAEETPKIKVFGDSPTTEDGLGFDYYADILLGIIRDFDIENPLTIGIHGRWGSGKTSLMRMLEKRFGDGRGVKTIWFNAWAYGRDEPIGLALLQQILIGFQKEEKLTVKGMKLLGNIGKLGTDAVLRKTTTITLKEAENLFESSVGTRNCSAPHCRVHAILKTPEHGICPTHLRHIRKRFSRCDHHAVVSFADGCYNYTRVADNLCAAILNSQNEIEVPVSDRS